MNKAVGLIEARGFTAAISALDAAAKAAEITLIGFEKIIGVDEAMGVNIQIAGEVAAVRAAVDAGVEAGNRVGKIISSHVIPKPHEDVDELIKRFAKNLKPKKRKAAAKTKTVAKKPSGGKKTSSGKKKIDDEKAPVGKETTDEKINKEE